MTLENYHYTIEIRKGILHTNADTLSRYVCCEGKQCMCPGVAELEDTDQIVDAFNPDDADAIPRVQVTSIRFGPEWSNEEMAFAQNNDGDIGPIYRAKMEHEPRPDYQDVSGGSPALKLYWSEWKRLEIHDTLLYRRWENDEGNVTRLQLIVPFRYQREISKRLHGPTGASHLGRRRTTEMIQRTMFWYQMADNIKFWVQVCDVCQKRKRPGITGRAPMREYMSGYCNERVQMDVCGPVNESYHGNLYLLVITDRFSKFTKAYAMPDQKAKTIAEIFVTKWLHEYGEPEQVHTDQGQSFEAELMNQVWQLYDIKKSRSSPYHPQGNAQVERYNQTIAAMLSTLQTDYRDWDMKVPLAVSSYNATIHATTGFTPNKLWYGRELYLRADRVMPRNPLMQRMTQDKYVERLEQDMRIAYEVARDTIGRNMKVQKRYHDRKAHLNFYKVGDAVLKRCMAPREKGTKKFAPRWVGPYYVIDRLDDHTYRIADKENAPKKVLHHDRLKPYLFEPGTEVNIDWVYKASKTKVNEPRRTISTQTDREDIEQPPQIEQEETTQLPTSDETFDQQEEPLVTGDSASRDVTLVGKPDEIATLMSPVKTVKITSKFPDVQTIVKMDRRGRPRKNTQVISVLTSHVSSTPRNYTNFDPQRFQRMKMPSIQLNTVLEVDE